MLLMTIQLQSQVLDLCAGGSNGMISATIQGKVFVTDFKHILYFFLWLSFFLTVPPQKWHGTELLN